MRTLRLGCVVLLFSVATGCSDLPTEPITPTQEAAFGERDAVQGCVITGTCLLPPIVVDGGGCDPWLDPNWCEGGDFECMESIGVPTSPEYVGIASCPPGGGPGDPTGPGGNTPSPNDESCNPNTNPDCFQPLSIWDKTTIQHAFELYLRTTFADPNAGQMCNMLVAQFNQMMAAGRVGRGAFGSTGEPNDPLHVAAYDPIGRTIHFEPGPMAAANAGDATAIRDILNSALHEAAHSLGYNHTDPLWMGSYDLYAESPFNLLSPGTNSCITNW